MGIHNQIQPLNRNSRSTTRFCDTVADASNTLAGSFLARLGLIVCSAERTATDACWASMSTRRAARASNTWS